MTPDEEKELIGDTIATELSANRTAMSFERTALSNHRTLLSMLRTSLSLIGFGFTIFKFFSSLSSEYLQGRFPQDAAKQFGLSLLVMGVVLLILGIIDHFLAMRMLRHRKRRLVELGLVHNYLPVRMASSMAISIGSLVVALLALANILFSIGPE